MDITSGEEPRYYSQETAGAMHHELVEARARVRQLENLVGILNREADYQAATITQLREDVEHWRSLLTRGSRLTDTQEE